jgi:hypothetical protein
VNRQDDTPTTTELPIGDDSGVARRSGTVLGMITEAGQPIDPRVAATRDGERAAVTFVHARPGTTPVVSLIEGTIVESVLPDHLTLDVGGRHKGIHLSRVQRVVVPPTTDSTAGAQG